MLVISQVGSTSADTRWSSPRASRRATCSRRSRGAILASAIGSTSVRDVIGAPLAVPGHSPTNLAPPAEHLVSAASARGDYAARGAWEQGATPERAPHDLLLGC